VKVSELNFFPSFNYHVSGTDHNNVSLHDLSRGIGQIDHRLVGFLGEEWGERKRQSNPEAPVDSSSFDHSATDKGKLSFLV
jgi:hypothetical protein